MIEEALKLLESERDWWQPFPMGVFGTLRSGMGNNHRMHKGQVTKVRKAFMPHFIAHGLSISFKEGSSAPFEVFFYSPEEWKKMIPGVDSLEGFRPGSRYKYGYHRTLANLRLLPEDFEHDLFKYVNLGDFRDLEIPQEQWESFQWVPCWVYSSMSQNEKAQKCGTIIWE